MKPRQSGAALLLMMVALLSIAAGLTLAAARGLVQPALAREARGGDDMALARDALAGAARTAFCLDPALPLDQLLPCPDLGGAEGEAAVACPGVSRGWLPWKTLNLPPLRDPSGTCLWYERSGAGGRVVAAGGAGAGQLRANLPARSVCGGNHDPLAYLDASDVAVAIVVDVASLAAACAPP